MFKEYENQILNRSARRIVKIIVYRKIGKRYIWWNLRNLVNNKIE
jgi:hypothetical protein